MNPHTVSLLTTFLLVFAAAIGGGTIARVFGQPTIVGYIGAGAVAGAVSAGSVDKGTLALISEAGVTLLLFTLGIEFSFLRLQKVIRSVLLPAVLQLALCIAAFFALAIGLGIGPVASAFLASAFSLSSTAVVVKVLSERGELDTVPGETATGWLVVQDLAVIPLMLLLPSLLRGTILSVGLAVIVSVGTISAVILLARVGIPRLVAAAAAIGSRETLLLTTVAVVFLSSVVFSAIGLSAALGAFVAGLIIAETSQNHAIFAEVRPLRDVCSSIFFIALGMSVDPSVVAMRAGAVVTFLMAIILLKGGAIYALLRLLGYHAKSAFLVGVSLTQVSEFGFVIAAVGERIGALSPSEYSFLVAVTFGSLLFTTPVVASAHSLYYRLRWFLPKDHGGAGSESQRPAQKHVVICGYGRVGKYVGRALEMAGIPFLVVDYNHQTAKLLRERGTHVIYGDPAERNVLERAHVDAAHSIVIAIPDWHTQQLIIAHAQTLNRRIRIICRTHHEEEQALLRSLGATVVVQPEFEAAVAIVERLLPEWGVAPQDMSGKISRLKIEHGMG